MVKNAIKVYARLKPERSRQNIANYQIINRPKDHLEEDFLVLIAPQKTNEYIDHRPESWNFSFYRVFEENTGQKDIFENVAQPVLDSVLGGYNGTIFAYGQTGSGKTYTITGDQKAHDARGIIPRSLHYLFDVIRKHPENVYSVEVAYLEIYNENGYDLLDRKQRHEFAPTRLEDLPRVTIQEDEIGRLHLKNLTFHCVGNEQDAFKLLLVGDTNRVTADTPMNPQSSRSHCIFTIVLSIKQFGADRYKRAKVHLVDLAGSERVYKCAITGTILTEAKHINLSLHYLEQVIVCLGQESAGHIPYRNSLLTAILRDSLGGNCLTTMLATLSISFSNLEETISTCRFSQRVSLIKNDLNLVLEKDVESENKLLKLENERLKQQIEILTKQKTSRELTVEEKESLDSQVRGFLQSNSTVSWDYEPQKIQYCFEAMKTNFILGSNKDNCLEKLYYYKDLVIQRDKEISLLIDILKKEKAKKISFSKQNGTVENGNDHRLRLNEEKILLSTTLNSQLLSKKNEAVNISLQQMKYVDSQAQLEIDTILHNYTKEDKSDIVENVDIFNNGSDEHVTPMSINLQKNNVTDKALNIIPHKNERSKNVYKKLENDNTPTPNKKNIKENEAEEFQFNRQKVASSCSISKKLLSKLKSISNDQPNPRPFPCKVINLDLYDEFEIKDKKNKVAETKCEATSLTRRSQQKLLDTTQLKSEDVQRLLKHNFETSTQSPNLIQKRESKKCTEQSISMEHISNRKENKNIKNDVTEHTKKDTQNTEPCISQRFTYVSIPKSLSQPNMPDNWSYSQIGSYPNSVADLHDTSAREYQSRHQIKNYQIKNNCTTFGTRSPADYCIDSTRKEHNSYEMAGDSVQNSSARKKLALNIDMDIKKNMNKKSEKDMSDNLTSKMSTSDTATAQKELKRDIESCAKLNTSVPKKTQSYNCIDDKRNEYLSGLEEFDTLTADLENPNEFYDKSLKKTESRDFNEITSSFEKSLPLTGDSEIDEEIIAFYRAKRSGGIY